jgi:hypothetical protein
MTDKLDIEYDIGEDGKVEFQLPPDTVRGRVRISIEPLEEATSEPEIDANDPDYDPELEALLTDVNLRGQGLTAEEIANAPEIGIWKDRTDIFDGAAYVDAIRRKRYTWYGEIKPDQED